MKEIMNIINEQKTKEEKIDKGKGKSDKLNTTPNINNSEIPSVQNINTNNANLQTNNHTNSSQQIYRVNLADGSVYTGTFKSCFKDGFGRLDYPNGLSYEGEFKNDNFNGKGILMMEKDMYYEGNFKNGLKQGMGILKSIHTNYLYDGEWANDFKHGFGKKNISLFFFVEYLLFNLLNLFNF